MKLNNVIYCKDNLWKMKEMPDEFVDVIYADPPFFSNKYYFAGTELCSMRS